MRPEGREQLPGTAVAALMPMTTRRRTVAWCLVLGFSVVLGCRNQATGARFACGDASCSVDLEFCFDQTNPHGGASGANDAGDPVQIRSCKSFGACSAHDCSCITACGFCINEMDGGTLALCGPI